MARAQASGRSAEERADGTIACRWMCPYCGTGDVTAPVTEAAKAQAIGALRAHVAEASGSGHGPRDALPDDDQLTLTHHVIVVDGG